MIDAGVIIGGTILASPVSLPGSTQMLVVDASGQMSTQSIPTAGITQAAADGRYLQLTGDFVGGNTEFGANLDITGTLRLEDSSTDLMVAITVDNGALLVGGSPIGGGGVTDHGSLTGLGDDDHTQYYNASRLTTALSGYATTSAVAAAYQPLDSDLTAIAALSTTSFGRSLLTQVDAAAARSTLAAQATLVSGTNVKTVNGTSLLGSGNIDAGANVIGASVAHFRDVLMETISGTGTLVIKLPTATFDSATMLNITIRGFQYGAFNAADWEVELSGYNFSGATWYAVAAEIRGTPPFTSIRLGSDGTRQVILLGTTSTSWSIGKVVVTDVLTHNGAGFDDFGSGWASAIVTSETGITVGSTPDPVSQYTLALASVPTSMPGLMATQIREFLQIIFGSIYLRLGLLNLSGAGKGYPSYLQAGNAGGVSYNLLMQLNGGNVGIGTDDPKAPLDIAGSVRSQPASGASDPTTSNIASGCGTWWKNTTSGEVRYWVNDSGTMKKSAALT